MTGGRDQTQRSPWFVPALLTLLAAAGIALAAFAVFRPEQPETIDAAVAAYRASAAPHGAATRAAPDLSPAGLTLDAAGITTLEDEAGPVDTFVYVGDDGTRVVLYVGARPFPRPLGIPEDETSDRWTADVDDVFMTSIEEPNPFLLVSSDRASVERAAGFAERQIEPSRFQGHRTAQPSVEPEVDAG
ncbi:MAG: hypothetical protein WD004_07835 [Actinomycetota bacterium]